MANIKSTSEIEKMKISGNLASRVLEMIAGYVKPGISTNELDEICHNYIINDLKAIPSPLNYRGFPKSICTSINHQVCHGIPSKEKTLKNGDIVNIDITVCKNEFHGDTSKMFFVGKPSILAKRLCQVTRECMVKAIKLVKPGLHVGDIGAVIQEHAYKNNFTVVKDYCGHGIGKNFHEAPQILHYGIRNTGIILKEGMTFTIEPMINSGKEETKVLNDGWTVVTRDRSLSAQYEHTILVTKDGNEVLTIRKEEDPFEFK
tara:strand:+ start:870 stop:1649 length:780 start_codon:yes stop_codon:yes gene_type:complete